MESKRPALFGLHCYQGLSLGSKRPYYSPFSGAYTGPPLTSRLAVELTRVQEEPHHFLASTPTVDFMRQVVGKLHDFIAIIADMSGERRPPGPGDEAPHLLDVPLFRQSGVLRLMKRLLDHVHQSTQLVQEAFALEHCIYRLGRMTRASDHFAREIDIEAFESKAVAQTGIKDFADVYHRYKDVARKSEMLVDWIAIYALSGPSPHFSWSEELAQARKNPGKLDEFAVVLGGLKGVSTGEAFNSWDSPLERFYRILAVAEQMPRITRKKREVDEAVEYLRDSLKDYKESVFRYLLPPENLEVPLFGGLTGLGRAVIDWGRTLWTRSPREYGFARMKGESDVPPLKLGPEEMNGRSLRALTPPFYLEHHEDLKKDTYRLHELIRGKITEEPLPLILQMEFLREQLFTGKGLVCLYDMFDGVTHPKRPKSPRDREWWHWQMLTSLWDRTRLSDNPDPEWYWTPPSCIDRKPIDWGE